MCQYRVNRYIRCGHVSAPFVRPGDECQAARARPPSELTGDINVCYPPPNPPVAQVNECCDFHCCTTAILGDLQHHSATKAHYLDAKEVLRQGRQDPNQLPPASAQAYALHRNCVYTQTQAKPPTMPLAHCIQAANQLNTALIDGGNAAWGWPPNSFWGGWGGRPGQGMGPFDDPPPPQRGPGTPVYGAGSQQQGNGRGGGNRGVTPPAQGPPRGRGGNGNGRGQGNGQGRGAHGGRGH